MLFSKKIILLLTLSAFISSVFLIPATAQAANLYKTEQDCNNGTEHTKIDMPKNAIRLQIPILGVTETTKAFKQEFVGASIKCVEKPVYYIKDLQTYIKKVYTFFIGAIALSAIVMMMIGGFQYVLAAGNESRITTAKQIISGALGGLILSLFSFVLLNTINPRITNLQLKEAKPISEIKRDLFCDKFPKTTSFVKLDENGNKESDPFAYNKVKEKAICGNVYNIVDKKKITKNSCLGLSCKAEDTEDVKKSCVAGQCVEATISGMYEFEDRKFIDNNIYFKVYCVPKGKTQVSQAEIIELINIDLPKPSGKTPYALPGNIKDLIEVCNPEKIFGFFLEAEINDPGGIDDNYIFTAVKRASGNSYDCNKAFKMCQNPKIKNDLYPAGPDGRASCDNRIPIYDPSKMVFSNRFEDSGLPFGKDAFNKGPIKCDISINEKDFPDNYKF